MHTRYFQNVQQVEEAFGRPLTIKEIEYVHAYLRTGVRPNPGGCWHCTESEMLKLTGWIDRYEELVDEGLAPSPGEDDFGKSTTGLPYGSYWG